MKTILFLGQAPARPTSKHEIPGKYLHAWLKSIGFSEDDIAASCHFYALIADFPGMTKHGHIAPTPAQIELHRPALVKALRSIQPQLIVPVGKMAISEVLGKNILLEDVVGKECSVNPFDALTEKIPCVPLSHPSGRSVWNVTHTQQVLQALELLKQRAA